MWNNVNFCHFIQALQSKGAKIIQFTKPTITILLLACLTTKQRTKKQQNFLFRWFHATNQSLKTKASHKLHKEWKSNKVNEIDEAITNSMSLSTRSTLIFSARDIKNRFSVTKPYPPSPPMHQLVRTQTPPLIDSSNNTHGDTNHWNSVPNLTFGDSSMNSLEFQFKFQQMEVEFRQRNSNSMKATSNGG
jgi:hypothetical protein